MLNYSAIVETQFVISDFAFELLSKARNIKIKINITKGRNYRL